jgi:hypothetical protein
MSRLPRQMPHLDGQMSRLDARMPHLDAPFFPFPVRNHNSQPNKNQ